METKHRHLMEQGDKVLVTVQDLEEWLGVAAGGPWECTGTEWAAATEKVRLRRHQRALDTLKGLVVTWIFEHEHVMIGECITLISLLQL
jgi:hypothetical protein